MQTIKLDIVNRDIMPTVTTKQGDIGRKVCFQITNQGEYQYIPSNVVVCLWYSGSSGMGSYTAIGDRSAYSVDDDMVFVELIPAMLQCAGGGTLCLTIYYDDGTILGTWNLLYVCEAIPGANSSEAVNYYTAFSEMAQKAVEAATKMSTDETLSVSGVAADAKAVGDALENLDLSQFGIGTEVYGTTNKVNDLNDHTLGTGYYYCTANITNEPEGFGGGPLYVLNWQNGSLCMQILMNNILSQIYMRRYEDGTWMPWCYLNPPMTAGKIYRTAEYWNGKAVYAVQLHFNALADSADVYQKIGLTLAEAPNLTLIEDHFTFRSSNSNNQFSNSEIALGRFIHWVFKDSTYWYYRITSDFDASEYSADATIKFVYDEV